MNSQSVVLVLVPGLGRGLLEGGALPHLRADLAEARVAGLVSGLPSLPESIEASALRGQLPARHRIRLSGDRPSPAHPTIGERLEARREGSFLDAGCLPLSELELSARAELTVVRVPALLEAALRHGPRSLSRLQAAAELDAGLKALRSRLPLESILLVMGAPGVRCAGKRVRVPEALSRHAVEIESGVLRVRPRREATVGELREELLRHRGVERVLTGEALAAWGAAPENEPGELYALAQSGWSFEDAAAAVGHPELPREESGVLMGFGVGPGAPWAPDLHDHRLAPTLARNFGLPEDEYLDRAFPL